jgi:hypothetical protein
MLCRNERGREGGEESEKQGKTDRQSFRFMIHGVFPQIPCTPVYSQGKAPPTDREDSRLRRFGASSQRFRFLKEKAERIALAKRAVLGLLSTHE